MEEALMSKFGLVRTAALNPHEDAKRIIFVITNFNQWQQ